MNEDDKKELIEEFKKGDGAKRLDLWDYGLAQQVLWEDITPAIFLRNNKYQFIGRVGFFQ